MTDETINIVSGLPRSGTSLMMRMLHKGGLEPLTDEIRTPDDDNPKGYYEFERVKKLPDDSGWLPDARGKVVKILAELIKHLPSGYRYRIVFMMRNIDEIVRSQKKMMKNRGENPDDVPDDEMAELLRRYLVLLKQTVNARDDMEVLYISYNDLLVDPDMSIMELEEFFPRKLNSETMKNAIDPGLYRNRSM
jgi:hypothetical protein